MPGDFVARSTRAWIETDGSYANYQREKKVARSTRAWIETIITL